MKILVNPYFVANKKFKDDRISDRTNEIDTLANNIHQVFVANYLNYIYSENVFDFSFLNVEKKILKDLLEGTSSDGSLRFQEYAQWELAQDLDMHNEQIDEYREFLRQNDHYFHSLDLLSSSLRLSDPAYYFKLNELPETPVSKTLILNEIKKFTKFLIGFTRFSLLNEMTYSGEINFETKKAQIFNFEALQNELTQESSENQVYIIEMLRDCIHKIGKEFVIKVIINEKLKIIEFIDSEIDVMKSKLDLEKKVLNIKNSELVKAQNYPKHIFKDEIAYFLFHTIAIEMETHAQISFLFRQMSEKEKPELIICRDAVFRNWFNTQVYKLKLDNVTKRLSDSSTVDRLTLYALVKKLLNIQD